MDRNLKKTILSLGIDIEQALIIPDDIQKLLDLQNIRTQAEQPGSMVAYPEDFLEEAERLFETGEQKVLPELVSSTRHAVHLQMDEWMKGLGFESGLPFKKKLEILKELRFAPRILQRLSESGILLDEDEREVRVPQEVEETLDLAQLFVLMSRSAILPLKLLIGNDQNLDRNGNYYRFRSGLEVAFKPAERACKVIVYNKLPDEMGHHAPDSILGEAVFPISDPHYLLVIRLILAVGTASKAKEKKALQALWERL